MGRDMKVIEGGKKDKPPRMPSSNRFTPRSGSIISVVYALEEREQNGGEFYFEVDDREGKEAYFLMFRDGEGNVSDVIQRRVNRPKVFLTAEAAFLFLVGANPEKKSHNLPILSHHLEEGKKKVRD